MKIVSPLFFSPSLVFLLARMEDLPYSPDFVMSGRSDRGKKHFGQNFVNVDPEVCLGLGMVTHTLMHVTVRNS